MALRTYTGKRLVLSKKGEHISVLRIQTPLGNLNRIFYTKLLRKRHILAQFGLSCLPGGRFFQFLTLKISHF